MKVLLSFFENCFLKDAGILILFLESILNENSPVNVYWLLIIKGFQPTINHLCYNIQGVYVNKIV